MTNCKISIEQFAGTKREPICKLMLKVGAFTTEGKLEYNLTNKQLIEYSIGTFMASVAKDKGFSGLLDEVIKAAPKRAKSYGIKYYRKFTLEDVANA